MDETRQQLTTLQEVITRLRSTYGSPARQLELPDPVDELIQTILSQNTSDYNTARAFASLKQRFPAWDMVIEADTADVADAIRTGGLANTKAPRIQRVLREIYAERGDFDLDFLRDMPAPAVLAWLTRFHGVGPKTAACVALFSLKLPVMPVDTHVHRVAGRLGLLPSGISADRAHGQLEQDMDADGVYDAHLLLIEHGRRVCRARAPRCDVCVLNDICPAAFKAAT